MTERLSGSGAYSEAVAVDGPGRWIHVAGQLGVDLRADGPAPDDLGAQAAVALDALERTLQRMGAELGDVVRTTVYVTRFDDWDAFAAVRRERFGDSLPASTAVQVAGLLGGALIEIDAVAFVPQKLI